MQRIRFGRAAATAMAIASLAVAATAATASASDVGPMTDATGKNAFGNNWQFGAPQLPGILDWNVAGANTTPVLSGSHFLEELARRQRARAAPPLRREPQRDRHTGPARSSTAPRASSSGRSTSAT